MTDICKTGHYINGTYFRIQVKQNIGNFTSLNLTYTVFQSPNQFVVCVRRPKTSWDVLLLDGFFSFDLWLINSHHHAIFFHIFNLPTMSTNLLCLPTYLTMATYLLLPSSLPTSTFLPTYFYLSLFICHYISLFNCRTQWSCFISPNLTWSSST